MISWLITNSIAPAASARPQGSRLAERVAGKDGGRAVFELPIYRSPLPFPNVMGMVESPLFAPFRRLGQRALYKWYWLRDEK